MKKKKANTITLKYYFIICVYTMIDFLFGPAYTTFMQDKGMEVEQIGLILAIWSIFSFIFEIPSGSLADKYGRKRAMLCGFIFTDCFWDVFDQRNAGSMVCIYKHGGRMLFSGCFIRFTGSFALFVNADRCAFYFSVFNGQRKYAISFSRYDSILFLPGAVLSV